MKLFSRCIVKMSIGNEVRLAMSRVKGKHLFHVLRYNRMEYIVKGVAFVASLHLQGRFFGQAV